MGDFPGHPFRGNQYTHGGLVSGLTREDAKRSARARARGHYDNPHAIALELQAADRVEKRVKKGEHPRDAFADEFNPTASNHRIAKQLGLGLDVQRGQWVKPAQVREDGLAKPLPGVSLSRGDYRAVKTAKTTSARVDAMLKIADKLAKQNPDSPLGRTRRFGHGGQ